MAQSDTDNKSADNPALLNAFIYLNLIPNTVFLPLLVGTFLFSRTATRHPLLVNVLIVWIVSGVFSCLLFFAGQHVGPEPNKDLCVIQTALMYGLTPMWSVAILMLVSHMVLLINDHYSKQSKFAAIRLPVMLLAPYLAHLGFAIAALIVSFHYPDRVTRRRRFFYCSVKMEPLANTMLGFTFIIGVLYTALEVYLGVALYRNWRGIRLARRSGPLDMQILLRVLAFGIYIFFGMVVSIIAVFNQGGRVPDIFAATFGSALVLVYGTQADIFRAWCFWQRKPEPVIPHSPVNRTGTFVPVRVDLIEDPEEPTVCEITKPPIAWQVGRY